MNVEPGWRRAWESRLNWLFARPGITAAIALIAPLEGSIEISAAAGSSGSVRVELIASCARRCHRGTIVVYTRSPPDRTVSAP